MTVAQALGVAAVQQVGLWRDDAHNYYWRPAVSEQVVGPIPSVTGILKVVDKSGPLVGWAKRITAEAAIKYAPEIPSWVHDFGAGQAIAMLGARANQDRDKKADVGSRVHALAEAITRNQQVVVTDEEKPFVDAYRLFLDEWRPKFLASEEMVLSLEHEYAGTLDWIAVIDGVLTIGDIKTGKGIYPETALQLVAYARAEFIGRPGRIQKFRIPNVTTGAVLHLRPEGYELVPYEISDDTFAAFLNARRLHRWMNTEAKTVMGAPLARREVA